MQTLTAAQELEIGGLALSFVAVDEPMLVVRAAQWRNTLAKVGIGLPLWVVHDVGLVLVHPVASVGPRPFIERMPLAPEMRNVLATWRETLEEIARTEAAERARAWRLSDALVVVVLMRLLGSSYERHVGPGRRALPEPLPLDPEAYARLDARLPALFAAGGDRRADWSLLVHLAQERLRLLTAVDQLDLDTLRLLGMLGAEASAASAVGAIDLLHVLESPEAHDIVNFSLDLLPSVLETRRATGAQTFAADGYAGLARRGSIDSLILSELAYDEDLFDQRFVENEVFFYAREKSHREERRCHYICVDATASMRGQRAVFARGLALTMVKKLQLRGEDVCFRFFDSRLYEVHQARAGRAGRGIDVPYVLAFKGEHGRNYPKVLAALAQDLARLVRRERASVTLYLVTHAECHIPLDVVGRLRALAAIYGIFMLPSSGELDLEYLPLLTKVQVVTQAALERREERVRRAMDIVEDAAGESRGGRGSRASLAPPSALTEEDQRAADLAAAERELNELFGSRS